MKKKTEPMKIKILYRLVFLKKQPTQLFLHLSNTADESADFFDNDFPEYPGGGAGFWKQYGQEMDIVTKENC